MLTQPFSLSFHSSSLFWWLLQTCSSYLFNVSRTILFRYDSSKGDSDQLGFKESTSPYWIFAWCVTIDHCLALSTNFLFSVQLIQSKTWSKKQNPYAEWAQTFKFLVCGSDSMKRNSGCFTFTCQMSISYANLKVLKYGCLIFNWPLEPIQNTILTKKGSTQTFLACGIGDPWRFVRMIHNLF